MSEATYYRATANPAPDRPSLTGVNHAEVCVVGGGFAGLATVLGLAERGVKDIELLEAEQIGSGASGRNGGFVFGGYALGEEALATRIGADNARRMYGYVLDAVKRMRERIRRYSIDCDPVDAGIMWANWFDDDALLERKRRFMAETLGVHWQPVSRQQLAEQIDSKRYHGGLLEADGFHFHPLNYALGVAAGAEQQGVRIHEHSPVRAIEPDGNGWRVRTDGGEVRARRVVVTCGGYIDGLHRPLARAVLPISTYVMVTEPLGARLGEILSENYAVYDTRFAFDYYRPLPDSRLLWGGRISIRRNPHDIVGLLKADMLKVFPQLEDVAVEYAWGGLMGYSRHKMPHIGELAPGLWYCQSFGGHGVAPTTAGGEIIASALVEGDERYREFADFGLDRTFGPAGLAAAQLSYWYYEFRDWLRS